MGQLTVHVLITWLTMCSLLTPLPLLSSLPILSSLHYPPLLPLSSKTLTAITLAMSEVYNHRILTSMSENIGV